MCQLKTARTSGEFRQQVAIILLDDPSKVEEVRKKALRNKHFGAGKLARELELLGRDIREKKRYGKEHEIPDLIRAKLN